jgi:hypothetical protein
LAEFEARGFPTVWGDGRLQEPLQALLAETAVLTGPFDLQQPMVDVTGNLWEVGQVLKILADPEIQGIVDGAFGASGAALLEVLLQIEAFVADMEAGGDAVSEDAGGESPGSASVIGRSKINWTRSGRPRSRFSRMTASKNSWPCTGRSKTWVREYSICQMDKRGA